MNTRQSWNITAGFLILLFGITLATILHPVSDFSEKENRTLQGRPAVSLSRVLDGTFEKEYEDYLADQFLMRDRWMELNTLASRMMLRQDVGDVYFASDNYLIEGHTGTFGTDLAAQNGAHLAAFAKEALQTYGGGHVTVMLVPNAVEVYGDKLPPFANPCDEHAYLESVRSLLPPDVWMDAEAVLKAHADEEIFYRTDHHWTTYGAWLCASEWAKEKGFSHLAGESPEVKIVSETFEGTVAAKVGTRPVPDTIERYLLPDTGGLELTYNQSDDVRSALFYESALDTRDQYSYFLGGNTSLIEIATGAGTGRRLLVLKDSYAHCFAPLLVQDFDQVDLLDLRYFTGSLHEYMESRGYTDVLVLYNAAGFAEDTSLARLAA